MAEPSQSGGGHQTDVASADNRYFHDCSPAMTARLGKLAVLGRPVSIQSDDDHGVNFGIQ
jgi:hypothetical protein